MVVEKLTKVSFDVGRPNMTKDEFIDELLTGLTNPPGYFPKNVLMNIQGYDSLDTETDALILDTRAPEVFAEGFVPNAINIGLDGNFAMWVAAKITEKVPTLDVPKTAYVCPSTLL